MPFLEPGLLEYHGLPREETIEPGAHAIPVYVIEELIIGRHVF